MCRGEKFNHYEGICSPPTQTCTMYLSLYTTASKASSIYVHVHLYIQRNFLKKDTTGTEESVLIREVSSFLGKKHMVFVGTFRIEKCPLFKDVLYKGFNCTY